jgi:hypothetical protein
MIDVARCEERSSMGCLRRSRDMRRFASKLVDGGSIAIAWDGYLECLPSSIVVVELVFSCLHDGCRRK